MKTHTAEREHHQQRESTGIKARWKRGAVQPSSDPWGNTTLCIRLQPGLHLIIFSSARVQHVCLLPPSIFVSVCSVLTSLPEASPSSSSLHPPPPPPASPLLQLHTERRAEAGSVSTPPANPPPHSTHTQSFLPSVSLATAQQHHTSCSAASPHPPVADKYFSLNWSVSESPHPRLKYSTAVCVCLCTCYIVRTKSVFLTEWGHLKWTSQRLRVRFRFWLRQGEELGNVLCTTRIKDIRS